MSSQSCCLIVLALLCPLLSEATLLSRRINPDLDPKSDKEFFGPPFPADYPSDKRPGGKHAFEYPFPHVQGSSSYDSDYVKDENNDNGEWKAQMEYDSLRAQLHKAKLEAEGAKKTQLEEAKEADQAENAYTDAQKAAEEAAEKAAKKAAEPVDDKKDLSKEDRIEEAQKEVEAKIKNLDDCKQQLKDAQDKLKALTEDAKKEREGEEATAAAEQELATKQAQEGNKSTQDKEQHAAQLKEKLEEEKQEEKEAEKAHSKEQSDVDELEKKLKVAEERLRAIRGGKSGASKEKSGASASASGLLSLTATLAAIAVVLSCQ